MNHPFESVNSDHCETPKEAYEHISHVLKSVCRDLNKRPEKLAIYDPFYCTGRVKGLLKSLGFPRVYNKPEDFYKVQKDGAVPKFDVLLTNPPYSGDHVDKLLTFCLESADRWMLCLPNYVFRSEFYKTFLEKMASEQNGNQPFFLSPIDRYTYVIPEQVTDRPEYVGEDGKHSPFLSSWMCSVGDKNMNQQYFDRLDKIRPRPGWIVTRTHKGAKWKLKKLRRISKNKHVKTNPRYDSNPKKRSRGRDNNRPKKQRSHANSTVSLSHSVPRVEMRPQQPPPKEKEAKRRKLAPAQPQPDTTVQEPRINTPVHSVTGLFNISRHQG